MRICRDYFGIEIDDEFEFADWSIALSALFFSDPTASTTTRELAVVAGDRLLKVIDRSIEAIRDGGGKSEQPLARLVALMDQGRLSLPDIHSVMLGMIAGFVPTNVLAGGNCLDVLLSRRDARQAIDAALAGNDTDRLDRIVLEAMRFKPIWVGPALHRARRDHSQGHATRAPGQGGNRGDAGNAVGDVRSRCRAKPKSVRHLAPAPRLPGVRPWHPSVHRRRDRQDQIGESLRALFQKQNVRRTPRQGRADDVCRRLPG